MAKRIARLNSKSVEERPGGDVSLQLCLLGPFRVLVDGRLVTARQWSRRKPIQLIKLLALQPHHQLHREQMIDLLWPDADPESGSNNLNKAIHLARHALEPDLESAADSRFLHTRAQQIVLRSSELSIDVEVFEREGEAAIKAEDSATCENALAIYRGDLLNEDACEDWAATRREQLRELYHRLLARLSKIHELNGDLELGIEPLKKLIASDTANEPAHRDLMRLYALTGKRHQALRQYQQCKDSLGSELNAEPEAATIKLHHQIEAGQFPKRAVVETQGAIESIAILPLLNTNDDPELEYLSDGLTEDIIDNLSRLPGLRVMAWGTVARFKASVITPVEIGRQLGVRLVLTGRMLQLNERLIVRTELIDTTDGAHVWGDAYDRKLADLFAMQADIARELSQNLRLKLTGEQTELLHRRHTENLGAYHAYLKSRFYWNKRTGEYLKKGVENFRHAIALDPNYALAYVGLSDSYTLLVVREAIPPEEGFANAKATASMALSGDESFGEAHASLGHAMLHNWEWQEAEQELKRAIELNPGYPSAHHWYSEYLAATGVFEAAIQAAKRSQELDPLSLIINLNVADLLYFARQYDEAIKQAEKALELDSTFWLTHMIAGKSAAQLRMYPDAFKQLQKASELLAGDTELLSLLGFTYAAAGRRPEALKILRQLQEQAKRDHVPLYHFAMIHTGLGENDQAFACLEQAFEKHAVDLFNLNVEPIFDGLRQDQRFRDLLRRVGF